MEILAAFVGAFSSFVFMYVFSFIQQRRRRPVLVVYRETVGATRGMVTNIGKEAAVIAQVPRLVLLPGAEQVFVFDRYDGVIEYRDLDGRKYSLDLPTGEGDTNG